MHTRFCIFCFLFLLCASNLPSQDRATPMSPVMTSRFGELLDKDWDNRPPWADMAVTILKGGQMGSGDGWFTPAVRRHDWQWLADSFPNAASDDRFNRGELPKLSKSDFDRIDSNGDNEITKDDFEFEKNPLLEDDSPFGDIFTRLDQDSNGRLTSDEVQRWFEQSADGTDFLSIEDFQSALAQKQRRPPRRPPGKRVDPRWGMLELLIKGEMGSLTEGPDLDDEAPELNLPLVAHKKEGSGLELTDRMVKLADARGDKPVVLVFGSFT